MTAPTVALNAAEAILGPPLARGQGADPAILFGDQTITYDQLSRRVNQWGNALLAEGLEQGERVLLLVLDRPEFIIAYLGTLRAGGVAVALNVRAAAADLAHAIADSGCRRVLVDAQFLPLFKEAAAQLAFAPEAIVTDEPVAGLRSFADLVAGRSETLAPAPTGPDDMAFWMYTSGTTGKPKGAVHCHRAVLGAHHFLGEILGAKPGDRLFCSSKLFFAFALGHAFFAALRLGLTTILYPGWPSAEAVAEVVGRYRPQLMLSVPTFYRNLLSEGFADDPAFRSVRHFVTAGEKLPEVLFERWQAATGRPLLEGIGATETVFLGLANRPNDYRAGSCGKPTPGTEVKLVGDDDRPVSAPGVPGILWVRMGSVAARYWNLPEKSAEAFQDGWYRTGDMFAIDADGFYHHQGRGDDMLKISGQWVSPAEIEDHVLRHPAVQDAAVIGLPNKDGLVRLALFMVPNDPRLDRAAFEAELQTQLTAQLSIYKCPRRIVYVDELPRTATGKVQRFMLRQMAGDQMGLNV